jgi:outer membrane protein assembly factor BamE
MIKKLLPVLLLTLLIQACVLYVPDVEQGNIVTQEMLENVEIGQTREQVKYHLGTPLISDSFHRDRWDYYYSLEKGRSKKRADKRLTIVFRNDRVTEIIRE